MRATFFFFLSVLVPVAVAAQSDGSIRSSSDVRIQQGAAAQASFLEYYIYDGDAYDDETQNEYPSLSSLSKGKFKHAGPHTTLCNLSGEDYEYEGYYVPGCPDEVSQAYPPINHQAERVLHFVCPGDTQLVHSECVYPDMSECSDCGPNARQGASLYWQPERTHREGEDWMACRWGFGGVMGSHPHRYNWFQVACQ